MVFEVSTAKREILQKLVQQDWTPTDLAEELGKSTSTVYNHLDELAEQGILTKKQVSAKTRPKTRYSIGNGFLQYITVLPGQYQERTLKLDTHKVATIRIWNIPQENFHPFIQDYWWSIRNSTDVNLEKDITAIAVYGSVARGEADEDSDIDILVIAKDGTTEGILNDTFGTLRLQTPEGNKIVVTEVFNQQDYRESLAQGSSFLENIQDELHTIYDPDRILQHELVATQ